MFSRPVGVLLLVGVAVTTAFADERDRATVNAAFIDRHVAALLVGAALSLLAFVVGMFRWNRGSSDVVVERTFNSGLPGIVRRRSGVLWGELKILYAWSPRVRRSQRESAEVLDLFDGLRRGDPSSVDFALRAFGLVGFALCAFLSVGFGLASAGESSGWVFVGFVVFFVAVNAARLRRRTAAPRLDKMTQ